MLHVKLIALLAGLHRDKQPALMLAIPMIQYTLQASKAQTIKLNTHMETWNQPGVRLRAWVPEIIFGVARERSG